MKHKKSNITPHDRDLPLQFTHQVSDSFLDHIIGEFQLKLATGKHSREAMRFLVSAAVFGARYGKNVSYARNSNFYTGKLFYYGKCFTEKYVVEGVDTGISCGMFIGHKALKGDHRRTGRQSWFSASPRLVEVCCGAVFQPVYHRNLRLKDDDGVLINFPETPETLSMSEAMTSINTALATIQIGWEPGSIEPHTVIQTDDGLVVPGPVQLVRIFNRGSFEMGGRLYGWYQNLPKDLRKKLTLDGEPVEELDFDSLHPHMLYAESGVQLNFSPYEYLLLDRKQRKLALLIAINAPTRHQAVKAIEKELGESDVHAGLLYLYSCVNNPLISHAIGSDAGIQLMRKDSDIAVSILQKLLRQKIPCLPVHDSFIVPQRFKEEARQAMCMAYSEAFPGFTCGVYTDEEKPRPESWAYEYEFDGSHRLSTNEMDPALEEDFVIEGYLEQGVITEEQALEYQLSKPISIIISLPPPYVRPEAECARPPNGCAENNIPVLTIKPKLFELFPACAGLARTFALLST